MKRLLLNCCILCVSVAKGVPCRKVIVVQNKTILKSSTKLRLELVL